MGDLDMPLVITGWESVNDGQSVDFTPIPVAAPPSLLGA